MASVRAADLIPRQRTKADLPPAPVVVVPGPAIPRAPIWPTAVWLAAAVLVPAVLLGSAGWIERLQRRPARVERLAPTHLEEGAPAVEVAPLPTSVPRAFPPAPHPESE